MAIKLEPKLLFDIILNKTKEFYYYNVNVSIFQYYSNIEISNVVNN